MSKMIYQEPQKKDASFINRLNKIEVLRLIRESGQISRAAIVKETKLSAPTVTRIVDSLIADKLAIMIGDGNSTGGRPPKLIKFDGTHNYVIGIDLGSTSIRAGISNLDGVLSTEIETPTDLDGGFEVVIKQVADLINKLIDRSNIVESKIMGAGLAVAGLINQTTGEVEYSPVFNWRRVDLQAELKKHIDLPVYYDNVSRVTAFGELLYGVGKEYKDFICVNVGYGIGAGIIINGTPFFGSQGFSGEFGHIILNSTSQYVGKDGIRGSLEALSSGYGIAEIAKSRIKEGGKTRILALADGQLEDISAKTVIDAAKEGDSIAMEIFNESMHYLGIGLDALVKLFNPKAIVLSGGVTYSGDIFFNKLKENISENHLSPVDQDPLLLPSTFKDDATLMGALSLIISKVLQFENGFY